jgi:SAM-dependent methyltransferase
MAGFRAHYEELLADVYSWMYGGWESNLSRYRELFAAQNVLPRGSRRALDLGAGCGFQSVPLAERGFAVTAIDLDRKLLAELEARASGLDVTALLGDLTDFARLCATPVELVVCMVDTLLHLESKAAVERLFADVHSALEPGGRFFATFRDLSVEARELDRFVPVRSDETTIFTCFLEFEPETVKVHDLVYRRDGERWMLRKSFYRKLRLSESWAVAALRAAGFAGVSAGRERGLVLLEGRRGP